MSDTQKVSPTCEVIETWDYNRDAKDQTYCGRLTAYWYPTQRGTMALCRGHAQKHLPSAAAIGLTPYATAGNGATTQTGQYNAPVPEPTGPIASPSRIPSVEGSKAP